MGHPLYIIMPWEEIRVKVTFPAVLRRWGVLRGMVTMSPFFRVILVAPSLSVARYSPDFPLGLAWVPFGVPPSS